MLLILSNKLAEGAIAVAADIASETYVIDLFNTQELKYTELS